MIKMVYKDLHSLNSEHDSVCKQKCQVGQILRVQNFFFKTKFSGEQHQPRRRRRNRNRNRRNRNLRHRYNNNNGRPASSPLVVMVTDVIDSDDENSDNEQLTRMFGRFGASNRRRQTFEQQQQLDERQMLATNNELHSFSQSIIDEIERQLNEEFDEKELYYNRLYKIMEAIYELVLK